MPLTLRALACLLAVTALVAQTPDELLVVDGRIFTGSSAAPWAEALLSRGDRIVAVGTEAAVRGPASRSALAAGVPFAIGTDGPLNPYLNIMFATINEVNPAEALTVEQALVAYTHGSAYAEHREQDKGTLEPAKLADFAILSQDIFTVPPPELPKTTSVVTVVGGRVVHEAK
jgi:predicted amidohydrolase YtcJ